MSDPFILVVPVDPRYRSLAPEVAAKYAELVGATTEEGQELAGVVAAELARLTADSDDRGGIELSFNYESGGLHVTARCEGRVAVVKHAVPVPKH